MQVKALKNLVYQREIRDTGTVFEMDDTSAYVQEKRGTVEIVGRKSATPAAPEIEMDLADGLPTLDEEAAAKRKRK